MALTGVNHVTLCVTDLARSIAFYADLLGARLRATGPKAAYLELGTLWLCLEHAEEVDKRHDDSHLALDCPADHFDRVASTLSDKALTWKENTSEGKSLYFLDPDGHKLEIHVGTLMDRLAYYAARDDAPMQIVLPA